VRAEPGKLRRGTTFKVSFPTMPSLTQKAAYVEIHQRQYHHDVLVVSFVRTSETWFKNIPTGLPIRVEWSQQKRKKEWVGYVSHVSKTVQAKLAKPMEVHCVGASYPLKERASRTFSDMTIPDVARIIAGEFGMNLVSDSHPTRFPQLTMAGHSYWEWLAEHAKKIGYALYCEGTTIHLKKVDRAVIAGASDSALLFIDDNYVPSGVKHYDKTLASFKVLKGDNVETSGALRAEKQTGGVDPNTSSIAKNSTSPSGMGVALREQNADVLFKEFRSDQVIQSSQTARDLAEGAATMARFNTPAKVKCKGDPRISPFNPVRVLGTGPLTDGLWIVKEARHTIRSNGEYEIEAVILTDGTGKNNQTNLRPEIDWEKGIVNIPEAIRNSTVMGAKWKPSVRLGNSQIRPKDAGFRKDNARWQSTGVTNGRTK